MKFEKVMQHTYKYEDWKIFGLPTKRNPTRSLKIVYFIKYKGREIQDFPGGTLKEAKKFLLLK